MDERVVEGREKVGHGENLLALNQVVRVARCFAAHGGVRNKANELAHCLPLVQSSPSSTPARPILSFRRKSRPLASTGGAFRTAINKSFLVVSIGPNST
mmetsp:Transcript_21224/g.49832  ORF Transcript_21224/g.49832 Transcript_21224/m.49832 type:complete len:99 (-) Transcript_21224:68-364(-)